MSVSYHNLRDEELAQRQQDLEDRVKVLIELDAEEVACYPAGFKVRTLHAYLMGLIVPHIEAIRQQKMELAEDEISVDENDDEPLALENASTPKPFDLPTQPLLAPPPQLFSPYNHIFCNNTNTTPPLDIVITPITEHICSTIPNLFSSSPNSTTALSKHCRTPTPTLEAEQTPHAFVLDVQG